MGYMDPDFEAQPPHDRQRTVRSFTLSPLRGAHPRHLTRQSLAVDVSATDLPAGDGLANPGPTLCATAAMEDMPMRKLRQEVYYQTDEPVQKGDEFYQLELMRDETDFKVECFHGFAGSPPPQPESIQSFQTLEAATDAFEDIAQRLEDEVSVSIIRQSMVPITHFRARPYENAPAATQKTPKFVLRNVQFVRESG
jgi:hypothetical protein